MRQGAIAAAPPTGDPRMPVSQNRPLAEMIQTKLPAELGALGNANNSSTDGPGRGRKRKRAEYEEDELREPEEGTEHRAWARAGVIGYFRGKNVLNWANTTCARPTAL